MKYRDTEVKGNALHDLISVTTMQIYARIEKFTVGSIPMRGYAKREMYCMIPYRP